VLQAQYPVYLFPLISSSPADRELRRIFISALSVFTAMVKTDDPVVIRFFVNSEIVATALNVVLSPDQLGRQLALGIIKHMSMHEDGIRHICSTPERVGAMLSALSRVVEMVNREVERQGDDMSERSVKRMSSIVSDTLQIMARVVTHLKGRVSKDIVPERLQGLLKSSFVIQTVSLSPKNKAAVTTLSSLGAGQAS
ncbi:hypothetical protein KIPB_005814, partial [Kipferlia bialata]